MMEAPDFLMIDAVGVRAAIWQGRKSDYAKKLQPRDCKADSKASSGLY